MALVIEAIITFNLVFVGLVVSDPRKRSILASIATGFSIGSGAMAAVSVTRSASGGVVAWEGRQGAASLASPRF